MITEPFWKISEKLLKRKKRWDSKLNPRNATFFLFHHWTTTIQIFSIFPKCLPRDQNTEEGGFIILVSPLGPKSQADFLEKKFNALEKTNGVVEKLDAHYDFFMLENCFSLSKLLYFLRTSTCFNHQDLLEKDDKTVRDGLSKMCNVNFDVIFAVMGSLGVSSPT